MGRYIYYSSWYLFMYFGIGGFLPYVIKFLGIRGVDPSNFGVILSLGIITTMIIQPFWGKIGDAYLPPEKLSKVLLLGSLFFGGCIFLFDIKYLVPFYIGYYVFYAGVMPTADSIALKSKYDFGKVRLWGSIGYALGAKTGGFLIEGYGIKSIFLINGISFLVAVIILEFIKKSSDLSINSRETTNKKSTFKELLKNKSYVLMVLSGVLVGGTLGGHNDFFNTYFEEIGGSTSGSGGAIMLFALSEVPFMFFSKRIAKKMDISLALAFSALFFSLRWILYGSIATPSIIMWTFLIQGASIGTFLVFSANFIRENVDKNLRGSAIALYQAIAIGGGGVIIRYITPKVAIHYGSYRSIYIFYFIVSILSTLSYIGLFLYRGSISSREKNFEKILIDLPLGYSEGVYNGRRYGIQKSQFNNGKSLKVYGSELGGKDFISLNYYITSGKKYINPCEMEKKKVMDFILNVKNIR